MRRGGILAVAALSLLLVGCGSPQLPFTESFRTAIPDALLESDLGIVEASADNGLSGLAVYLDVVVVFDRASVTSADLSEVIHIAVENNNLSNPYHLRVFGFDGTMEEPRDPLPLASLGEDLGFDAEGEGTGHFEADWDAVTDFVRSTDD